MTAYLRRLSTSLKAHRSFIKHKGFVSGITVVCKGSWKASTTQSTHIMNIQTNKHDYEVTRSLQETKHIGVVPF